MQRKTNCMLLIAQICTAILYVIVLILYLFNKHLPTYSSKIFKLYLYFGFFDIVLTTIEAYFIETKRCYVLQTILNKAVLVSILTSVFLLTLYILYETNGVSKYKQTIKMWIILLIIGVISAIVLPVDIVDDKVFYGYNCHIVYSIGILFLGTIFVTINHREKLITQKKLNILNISIVGYTAALFIEMATLKLSIIGIINTIILLFLFFEFENPLEFIDKETGLYNTPAFKEYIDDCRINDIMYDILLIDTNFHNITHTYQLKEILSRQLEKYKTGVVFKHLGNIFIIVYKRDDKVLETEYKKIEEALRTQIESSGLGKDYLPAYILVEDTNYTDTDILMKFIEKFREDNFLYNKSGIMAKIEKGDFDKSRKYEETRSILRKAIETENILVFLQPIYSIQEKRIVSAEVLMRIQDIDGNIIYPGTFMEVAESSGLIIEIETIILTKVCEFIKTHPLKELGLKYLELNLSARKGECETLVDEYKRILNQFNISPSQLNLEITESTALKKRKSLLKNINDLIDYGMSFSLDDFGSGESNLNYIIDMPVSIVKFDKDMTQSYFINPKAQTVIEYTINMIHQLGLKIVAEGVETKEQLIKMKELGIDYIQGYYFSKPVSMNNFIDYVYSYEINRNSEDK